MCWNRLIECETGAKDLILSRCVSKKEFEESNPGRARKDAREFDDFALAGAVKPSEARR